MSQNIRLEISRARLELYYKAETTDRKSVV